jgi:hypothetical protein
MCVRIRLEAGPNMLSPVLAVRVPAVHPRAVDAPLVLYNRRCVRGRDTPGQDCEMEICLP